MDASQRRSMERKEALAVQQTVFDFGEPDTVADSRPELIALLPKSPLMLLIMLHTPEFPLRPGDHLWLGDRRVTLLEDGRVQAEQRIHRSLSSAAHEYYPTKQQSPDGWTVLRYRYDYDTRDVSVNQLLARSWDALGCEPGELDTAEKMLERCRELGVEQFALQYYDDAVRKDAKHRAWSLKEKR